MKWKNSTPRPYYKKYQKIEAEHSAGWYDCYQLPGDVVAVCEPQHLQEVNVFLIFGEEKALMLDTGMGICPIRPLIRELCDRQDVLRAKAKGHYFDTLQLVNCHCHFDHTGNNWAFDGIWAADTELSRRTAARGVDHEPLANQMDEDMFLFDYPEGFDPKGYRIRPYRMLPCEDGHIFELGGRQVEFITTPGHTEDHGMLFDHRDKILFGGDMVYFGAIYVQFGNDVLGHSDIGQYIDSLDKIGRRGEGLSSIYVSHNDFIAQPSAIESIRAALIKVRDGEAAGQPLQDEKYGYYMDPPTVKEYPFEGFSIISAE